MKLYEFDPAIRALLEEGIDQETGELDAETYERLTELQLAKVEKAEAVGLYILEQGQDSKTLDEAIKRLQKRKKSLDNNVKGLKQYLHDNLNGEKVKTARVTIYSSRSAPAVKIDEGAEFSEKYYVQPEPVLSKTLLKEDLEKGIVIEGARLERTEFTVIRQ